MFVDSGCIKRIEREEEGGRSLVSVNEVLAFAYLLHFRS